MRKYNLFAESIPEHLKEKYTEMFIETCEELDKYDEEVE